MRETSRPAWVSSYGVALASVAVAAVLRAWLYRAVGDRLPFLTFLPALVVAAWYGGLGPGLLAVALSTLAAAAWIERPSVTLDSQPLDLLRLALFLVVGGFGVWLIDRFRVGRRRHDEAAAAQARLAAIVESSDDAVVGKSPEGTIQSWNAAASRLFGYTADEAVGRSIRMLIPEERAAEEDAILERLRRGERVDHFETVRVRKDGTRVEVAVTASPIRDAAGRIIGVSKIARDISDRRRADEARRMGEFRFQRLVEQSPLSTQVFAPDGTCRQVNRAWERLWGITLADIPGYNILRDPELERLGVAPLMRRAFAGEAVTIDPIPYVLDRGAYAGRPRWVGAYVYPVKDDAGRVAEVVLVHNDVTEQRAAQEALRESERRLRSLVEQSAAGIAQTDLAGRIQFANDRYCQIVGYPREEVLRLRVHDLTHPDDLAETTRLVAGGAATGQEYAMEKRYVRKDGSAVWVAVSASVIKDEAGRPQSIMGVVIDVSDRRQAEEALRRSHDTFYHLIQNDPFGVYVVDADFRLREVSAGAQAVFQHVPRPLIGRDFAEVLRSIWAEPFASEAIAKFRHTLATGERYASPRTIERRQDISEVEAYDWRIERITLPDGRFGVVCYFYDLSERQQYEAALRQSEERFRAAFDQSAAGIVLADLEGRVARCNDAYCRIVGRPREELVGHTSAAYTHPEDAARNVDIIGRLKAREADSTAYEKQYVRPDGTIVHAQITLSAVRDAAGAALGVIAVVEDVTQRRRAEARDRLLIALDEAVRPLSAPGEITANCARLLAEHLGADRCAYADVEADEDTFNLTGDYNREGVPSIVGRYRFADFGAEVLRLMREDRPYVVEDIDTHRPPVGDLSYYRQTMIQAVVCVPLHKAGRFVAAMAVHQRVPRRWLPEEVELVRHVAGRCWESIERARVERDLRQSEGRFRELADAMPQMVWVTRADGYHEYFNRRWYEFTGVPEGSTDGEGWNDLFHPDDRQQAWARWRHSLATGEPYEIEYRLRHHSGEYRWTLGRALPVRDGRGVIERWFGTCTEIDAMKRLTAEREQLLADERSARAEAERASNLKDEFLATLSHELRTPLNAILGYAQLLRHGGGLSADAAEGLDVIERNARVQTQIIEDLLEMSRIISGKLRLNVQSVDVADVVRAAAETVRPAADAKGVRLQVVLDPSANPVSGDPARLQQVVWNLLSNAIKFTPKGGLVQAVLRPVNSHVEVAVSDTGQGIKPEFLPYVFERFRQADASTTRKHGGLGLGLSIVKSIVEMHGGTVQAMSPGEGCGATFVVSLPLSVAHRHGVGADDDTDRQHPRAPRPAALAYDRPSLAGVRVLVVDDEPDARELVRRLLRDRGAEVVTAASADEALAALDGTGGAHVILSDIGMPEVDGYEFIRRVRARGAGRYGAVPAAALTAFARSEDRTRALIAGYQTHIAKPVEPTELVAAVAALAGRTGT